MQDVFERSQEQRHVFRSAVEAHQTQTPHFACQGAESAGNFNVVLREKRPGDVPGASREIEEATQESIGKSSGAGAKPSGSGAKS